MDRTSSKIWFKTRELGWGWTPVTREGHLVVKLFLVLVFSGTALAVYAVSLGLDKAIVGRVWMGWTLFLSVALIWIANKRGERPGSI